MENLDMSDLKSDAGAIHKERYSTMGRRRFIKTLLGIGFAGSSAAFITAEDVAAVDEDKVPIVTGFYSVNPHSKYQPYKKAVSAEWYNDFRHATKVKAQVENSLGSIPGVRGVGVRPGIEPEPSKISIDIHKSRWDSTRNEIPARINNVPTVTNKVGDLRPAACSTSSLRNWNPDWYTWLEGGLQVEGDSGIGTLSGATYKNGTKYFPSSQHIFADSSNEGKYLDAPDETRIGVVEADRCEEDFAISKPINGFEPRRKIKYSGYDGVRGHFTYDGLGDLRNQGAQPQKVGRTTCKTTFASLGDIDKTVWGAEGCLPKPYTVFLDTGQESDFDSGDSGSMGYYESPQNSNYCWAINLCNYEYPDKDAAFGIGCYRLHDFGYTF